MLGSKPLKKKAISLVTKLSLSLKNVINFSICSLSLAIILLFNFTKILNYKLATKLIYCQLLEFSKHEKD